MSHDRPVSAAMVVLALLALAVCDQAMALTWHSHDATIRDDTGAVGLVRGDILGSDTTSNAQLRFYLSTDSLGVTEQRLSGDNYEALAELAYHGLVEQAQKTLPILVTQDAQIVYHAGRIRSYLQRQARA